MIFDRIFFKSLPFNLDFIIILRKRLRCQSANYPILLVFLELRKPRRCHIKLDGVVTLTLKT